MKNKIFEFRNILSCNIAAYTTDTEEWRWANSEENCYYRLINAHRTRVGPGGPTEGWPKVNYYI